MGNTLDFILSFCREKIAGQGEDCHCHSFGDNVGLLGVFDGCGGAGARKHSFYSNHTEAYMASRLCAGVFYDCFRKNPPETVTPAQFIQEQLIPSLERCLGSYRPPRDAGSPVIKGSMVQTLPTTAAAVLLQFGDHETVKVSPIWAGDSRVYILDVRGLAQLTVDDTSVPDPMENLYEDGLLKRMVSADRAVRLRCHTVKVKPPFMVFTATDGCFGYVSTPMEFEGILLKTLMESETVDGWEKRLIKTIGAVAGDDHALCMAAFGYGSMAAIRQSLADRYALLQQRYLDPVSTLPLEDREGRRTLWRSYQRDYCRYLKDGNE